MCLAVSMWSMLKGDYFFISTKSASGKWEDVAYTSEDIRRGSKINAFVRDNRDKDVYFCPHGFSAAKRRAQYAVLPRLLWADMDYVHPDKVSLKPSICWESSPGRYQGLWLTDRVVTAELNKRLSYHLGFDKGGWDLTQVLRVPGTYNHKYPSHPQVRLLWDDGPAKYQVSELERILPAVRMTEREEVKLGEILPEMNLNDLTRKVKWALGACRLMPDRSQRLIHVARAMIRDGYENDEIASVLLTKGHAVSEHAYEQNNVRRAVARAIGAAQGEMHPDEINGFAILDSSFRRAAEVEEKKIDWLWYPYLARGELTILEGDPGRGKSYLMQMVGKALCDGDRLKSVDNTVVKVRGNVMFFDTENTLETVTLPRLRWNGIHNPKSFIQHDVPFNVHNPKAMATITKTIEELKPCLIVFDTFNMYIGGVDNNRANDATQALMPFRELARRFNCAVVLIRHLTKVGAKDRVSALYRGQGNIAITGVARIVLTCGPDPDDEIEEGVRRGLLLVTKMNLGPANIRALEYSIVRAGDMKDRYRSLFEWGDFKDTTPDESLAVTGERRGGKSWSALEMLQQRLGGGQRMEVSRLENVAKTLNISRRTLYRVARELGVKSELKTYEGGVKETLWYLDAISK